MPKVKLRRTESLYSFPNNELSAINVVTKPILPFDNDQSNMWIRIVDKYKKMHMIIKSHSDIKNLTKEEKTYLHEMFLNEIGTYGDMMFNISSLDAARWWKFRNSLTPLLNSILLMPKITVSSIQEDQLVDELAGNNPFGQMSDYLWNNSNLNKTQIENLQLVLDKIANKNSNVPASHMDLNNQIRVSNLEVKWLNEAFTTREAKLTIYLEHEMLLKTRALEYLTTINNRIKVSTEYIDIFGNDENMFKEFMSVFSDENKLSQNLNVVGPKTTEEIGKIYDEYREFINASKQDSIYDTWVINNFTTEFADDKSVKLVLDLITPGYTVKKRFDNILPINLMNKDIVEYFLDQNIMKISTTKSDNNNNGKTIYIPIMVSSNPPSVTMAPKDSGDNKELKKTYLVFDAIELMIRLLWLYAWEQKKAYDNTNLNKINKNFLITFEFDCSTRQSSGIKKNEAFNGTLMSKLTGDYDLNISLFNYKSISNILLSSDQQNSKTDLAMKYKSASDNIDEAYVWNFSSTTASQFSNSAYNKSFRDLLNKYPQTTTIEDRQIKYYKLGGTEYTETQLLNKKIEKADNLKRLESLSNSSETVKQSDVSNADVDVKVDMEIKQKILDNAYNKFINNLFIWRNKYNEMCPFGDFYLDSSDNITSISDTISDLPSFEPIKRNDYDSTHSIMSFREKGIVPKINLMLDSINNYNNHVNNFVKNMEKVIIATQIISTRYDEWTQNSENAYKKYSSNQQFLSNPEVKTKLDELRKLSVSAEKVRLELGMKNKHNNTYSIIDYDVQLMSTVDLYLKKYLEIIDYLNIYGGGTIEQIKHNQDLFYFFYYSGEEDFRNVRDMSSLNDKIQKYWIAFGIDIASNPFTLKDRINENVKENKSLHWLANSAKDFLNPKKYNAFLFQQCLNYAIKESDANSSQKPTASEFQIYFINKINDRINVIEVKKEKQKIINESKDDGWDNVKTLQELEASYTNLLKSPSRIDHEHYRNYYHPIAIFSAQDEAWLKQLKKPVRIFVKEMLNDIFNSRREAFKNFDIQFSDSDNNDNIWYTMNEQQIIKHKQSKDNQKDNQIKVKTEKIDPQFGNINELNIETVIHDKDYINKVDDGFRQFINEMQKDDQNNKTWLEIIISDTTKHILRNDDYKIYMDIQKSVFEGLDETCIGLNRYYDNNIISLQTQSETLSDIPYQLGIFSSKEKSTNNEDEKMKRIKDLITKDFTTLPQLDRSKMQNVVSMMQLMSENNGNSENNIDNIIEFIDDIKTRGEDNDEGIQKLYNAISGTDFASDVGRLGVDKTLQMSLYDSLMFRANGENYYVPGMKIYAPLFIYSAVDAASSIQSVINSEDQKLSDKNMFDLTSRIAPQTGMYKLTELSYVIDEYGNWTHKWQATKMDFGFLNMTHSIIHGTNDEKEKLLIDDTRISFEENIPNFFSSSFIFDSDNNWEEYMVTTITAADQYTHYYHKNLLKKLIEERKTNYRISPILDKQTVALQQNPSNLSENWPEKSTFWQNLVKSVYYCHDISKKIMSNYSNSFWLNSKSSPEWYDYIDQLNANTNQYNKQITNRESGIGYLFNPSYDDYVNVPSDLNVALNMFNDSNTYKNNSPSRKMHLTFNADKDATFNLSGYVFDTGTMLSVYRFDHPCISPDLRNLSSDMKKLLYDDYSDTMIRMCDTISVSGRKKNNFAWRNMEKFIILDYPYLLKFIEKYQPMGSIGSYEWSEYMRGSIDPSHNLYEWLRNNQLNFLFDERKVDYDMYGIHKKKLFRYAIDFLENIIEPYNVVYNNFQIKKKNKDELAFEVIRDADDSISAVREYIYENNNYSDYFINDHYYNESFDPLMGWKSIEEYVNEYNSYVKIELDKYISNEDFFQRVNGNEETAKNLALSKLKSLKLSMRGRIITKHAPSLIDEWHEHAKQKVDEINQYISEKQTNNRTIIDPMWFDFILINTNINLLWNIEDTCNFSAIKWDFVNGKNSMFYVSNMSLNDIFDASNRNEYNKIGVRTDYSNRISDKWIYTNSIPLTAIDSSSVPSLPRKQISWDGSSSKTINSNKPKPRTDRIALGASLAKGLGEACGWEYSAETGAGPIRVANIIREYVSNHNIEGVTVVINTGVPNNPDEAAYIHRQVSYIRDAGGIPYLLGAGPAGGKGIGWNEKIGYNADIHKVQWTGSFDKISGVTMESDGQHVSGKSSWKNILKTIGIDVDPIIQNETDTENIKKSEKVDTRAGDEGQLMPLASRIADEYGLNPILVWSIIKQESGWKPNIISQIRYYFNKDGSIKREVRDDEKGRGLMQLIPTTFDGIKIKKDSKIDNNASIFDPESNIRAGCNWLQSCFNKAKELEKAGKLPRVFGSIDEAACFGYIAGYGNIENAANFSPNTYSRSYWGHISKHINHYKKNGGYSYTFEYVDKDNQVTEGTISISEYNKRISQDMNMIGLRQMYYGKMNLIIDDSITQKNIIGSSDSSNSLNLDDGKLQIIDTWNYVNYGITMENIENIEKLFETELKIEFTGGVPYNYCFDTTDRVWPNISSLLENNREFIDNLQLFSILKKEKNIDPLVLPSNSYISNNPVSDSWV